eukprot:7206946-Prymnesium_polylepis.1
MKPAPAHTLEHELFLGLEVCPRAASFKVGATVVSTVLNPQAAPPCRHLKLGQERSGCAFCALFSYGWIAVPPTHLVPLVHSGLTHPPRRGARQTRGLASGVRNHKILPHCLA